MPKTRLLIACQPRTGSNWLCSLLQSHPQILCHHEVFHPDEIYYAVGHRDGRLSHLGSTHERDRDPLGFLEQLWHEDFGRSVVGIKLLDGQAPEVLARLLADTQVRKLVLRRQSRVRAYVSLLRARETGFWARTSYDGVAVRVEARELLESPDCARRPARSLRWRSSTRSSSAIRACSRACSSSWASTPRPSSCARTPRARAATRSGKRSATSTRWSWRCAAARSRRNWPGTPPPSASATPRAERACALQASGVPSRAAARRGG